MINHPHYNICLVGTRVNKEDRDKVSYFKQLSQSQDTVTDEYIFVSSVFKRTRHIMQCGHR